MDMIYVIKVAYNLTKVGFNFSFKVNFTIECDYLNCLLKDT